jgi:hypothetical protein
MQIELTIDSTAVGTIRGLAYLADTMSRLQPGQLVALESDGTERFLADRIEALARRRHYHVAWEGTPTDRTLRFRLELPRSEPAQAEQRAAVRLGSSDTKLEDRAAVAAAPFRVPTAEPTRTEPAQSPFMTGAPSSTGVDRVPAHLSGPLEGDRSGATEPLTRGAAGNAREPTIVSPEGEVVPFVRTPTRAAAALAQGRPEFLSRAAGTPVINALKGRDRQPGGRMPVATERQKRRSPPAFMA